MRFVGLALHDPVPDAKTIWLYREQLARAGAVERLFARFDELLRAKGWLAMGGQIVDATVIEARRPRLTQAEKDTIKDGGIPAEWKPARRAQIDRDGRWTLISSMIVRRCPDGVSAASSGRAWKAPPSHGARRSQQLRASTKRLPNTGSVCVAHAPTAEDPHLGLGRHRPDGGLQRIPLFMD